MISQYLIACALVPVLHTVAGVWVRPYGELLIAIGLHLVRGNDVSDLLNVFAAGAALLGGVLLCATAGVVYALRLAGSAD